MFCVYSHKRNRNPGLRLHYHSDRMCKLLFQCSCATLSTYFNYYVWTFDDSDYPKMFTKIRNWSQFQPLNTIWISRTVTFKVVFHFKRIRVIKISGFKYSVSCRRSRFKFVVANRLLLSPHVIRRIPLTSEFGADFRSCVVPSSRFRLKFESTGTSISGTYLQVCIYSKLNVTLDCATSISTVCIIDRIKKPFYGKLHPAHLYGYMQTNEYLCVNSI
jgi:hypothetical protein